MITRQLIAHIQEKLNNWYDRDHAVEITCVRQIPVPSPLPGPQLAGQFIVEFTCHSRLQGKASYFRLAHVVCDGVTPPTFPTTIITGTF